MNIKKLGKFENMDINIYELKNYYLNLSVTDFGAAICSVIVKNKDNEDVDVVLGFDNAEALINQNQYLGCTIGRYANRIGGAKFTLNGQKYKLTANEGKNQLHGGDGFDKKVFTVTEYSDKHITFLLHSPAMQGGFPQSVDLIVTYTLCKNAIKINYHAISDGDTPVNLTNHSYFNLAGGGNIGNHIVTIHANEYTPLKPDGIPTGEILPISGTPLDFNKPHRIGERIGHQMLAPFGGYDHNYCLSKANGNAAATAFCDETGIEMTVYTDMPGMQFYTGNGLDDLNSIGKGGVKYKKHSAFCMETQFYPDSPNQPNFPSTILHKGEEYSHETIYEFNTIR